MPRSSKKSCGPSAQNKLSQGLSCTLSYSMHWSESVLSVQVWRQVEPTAPTTQRGVSSESRRTESHGTARATQTSVLDGFELCAWQKLCVSLSVANEWQTPASAGRIGVGGDGGGASGGGGVEGGGDGGGGEGGGLGGGRGGGEGGSEGGSASRQANQFIGCTVAPPSSLIAGETETSLQMHVSMLAELPLQAAWPPVAM